MIHRAQKSVKLITKFTADEDFCLNLFNMSDKYLANIIFPCKKCPFLSIFVYYLTKHVVRLFFLLVVLSDCSSRVAIFIIYNFFFLVAMRKCLES